MKLLPLIPLALLAGCQADIDLTPTINDIGLSFSQTEVFSCTIDNIKRDCVFGPGQLTCNAADGFLYVFDTNAAILNPDNTSATCNTVTHVRFDGTITDIPLFKI